MNAGTDGVDSLGEVIYEASSLDTLKNVENIRATKTRSSCLRRLKSTGRWQYNFDTK